MKKYNIQYGIGKSKYIVNYHDGIKTHKDNSLFFDMAIFKSRAKLNIFVNDLKLKGYIE
jgi:hypothetical protein